MDQNNLLNPMVPLSEEDRFLLELLVDGELDDPNRRDLLLRLDRIQDGWRCCAVAFLEAQCLKETATDSAFQTALGVTPLGEPQTTDFDSDGCVEQTLYVSVREIPDPTPSPEPSDYSHPIEGNAALDSVIRSSATLGDMTTDVAEDPVIIPIRKGGFTQSRLGRRIDERLTKAGLSWKSFFASSACGFFLAVTLGIIFGEWEWRGNSPLTQSPMVAETSMNNLSANNPSAPSTSFTASAEPLIVRSKSATTANRSTFAESAQDDHYLADNASVKDNSDYPIRQVTLKRFQDDNGISVPCVETDSYNPNLLRQSTSDAYVKNLQKDGCQVETVYEELRFPLKDGKTLIVPVDTINVQRPTRQNFQ